MWTEKASSAMVQRMATGFALGGYGYLGLGWLNSSTMLDEFRRYDPQTDTWTPIDDFGGGPRTTAVAFTVGQVAYAGTGWVEPPLQATADIWSYHPEVVQGVSGDALQDRFRVFPQPATEVLHFTKDLAGQAEVFDHLGRRVLQRPLHAGHTTLPIGSLVPGAYTLVLGSGARARYAPFVKE